MKVYPITVFKPRSDKEHGRLSREDVQTNVDFNHGYPYYQPGKPARTDKVAVVGYGPWLEDNRTKLHGFENVWTVSGAYEYLRTRHVKANFHTDIDWRPHKMHMLPVPMEGTTFVMGNTVHPRYLTRLKAYNLQVFQPVGSTEDPTFRLGAYARVRIPGDAGSAALVLAYEEGFRDMTLVGFDGSVKINTASHHAGEHLGVRSDELYVTDETYEIHKTTEALVVSNMVLSATILQLEEEGCEINIVSGGLLPHWLAMERNRKTRNG